MQATSTEKPAVSLGDLIVLNNEPRITDEQLAKALGVARARDLRKVIERHKAEIESYGALDISRDTSRKSRGRPKAPLYLLNEHQAILVGMISESPKAAEVRKSLIQLFVAWRRGHQPAVISRADRQRSNRINYWKMQFAHCVMALDELGIDASTFDMQTVCTFARSMAGRSISSSGAR